jgi:hypothetical protein
MPALSVSVPFPVFQDRDGQPLDNGYVYIGVANLDAQTNPVQVYFDEALTITAAQPIRTINGYVSNAGTPAQLYVNAVNFSIKLLDAKGTFVYSFTDGTISIDASNVSYVPAGVGAVATTVQTKLRESVSVGDFGAVGDGVADDTVAIQAAIDAAYSAGGGTVFIPAGTYKVTSTINAKSYIKLVGAYGESSLFGVVNTKPGSCINWAGTTGSIFRVYNTRLFELDGVYIEGNSQNVTGILLDSDNNPSGSQNEFHRFSIRNCAIGVQWGTSGISSGAYANDGTRFSTFTIWSSVAGSKGFVVNSGNAGQMSVIESGGIQVEDIGIDIVVANILQIRRVFGGGVMDTAFIRASTAIDVLIEGCASEAWGIGRIWRTNRPKFLKVVAPVGAYPIIEATITLQQNQINNPILVEYPVRVVSVGDAWGYCKDYTTAADEPAIGTFTDASATGNKSRCIALNNGVNPASINLTTNEPAMGWIDGAHVNLSNFDPGRSWVSPAYSASYFTASGAMTWTVDPADVETYAYTLLNKTMTVSFKLNNTTTSGTPGNVLSIRIPNSKVATKSVTTLVKGNNGAILIATASVGAGGTTIDLQPIDVAVWANATNTRTIQGQITFEVN